METAIHRRVQRLRANADPGCIARMASGWAVLGERQFLHGYALLVVTGAVRINYAIFGNLEPALHVHVVPRFADEPEALRTAHPWEYNWENARAMDSRQDAELIARLRAALLESTPRQ